MNDKSKTDLPSDLIGQADRVAALSGIPRFIIQLPDGGIGIHTSQYIQERGLQDCPVLYAAVLTDTEAEGEFQKEIDEIESEES